MALQNMNPLDILARQSPRQQPQVRKSPNVPRASSMNMLANTLRPAPGKPMTGAPVQPAQPAEDMAVAQPYLNQLAAQNVAPAPQAVQPQTVQPQGAPSARLGGGLQSNRAQGTTPPPAPAPQPAPQPAAPATTSAAPGAIQPMSVGSRIGDVLSLGYGESTDEMDARHAKEAQGEKDRASAAAAAEKAAMPDPSYLAYEPNDQNSYENIAKTRADLMEPYFQKEYGEGLKNLETSIGLRNVGGGVNAAAYAKFEADFAAYKSAQLADMVQQDFQNKLQWEGFQHDIDKDLYDADWQKYKFSNLSATEKAYLDVELAKLQAAIDANDQSAIISIVKGIAGVGLIAAAIATGGATAPILVSAAAGTFSGM